MLREVIDSFLCHLENSKEQRTIYVSQLDIIMSYIPYANHDHFELTICIFNKNLLKSCSRLGTHTLIISIIQVLESKVDSYCLVKVE